MITSIATSTLLVWNKRGYRTCCGATARKSFRLTELAHKVWGEFVREGDCVVDATCGNGHDSVYLANVIGSEGRLVAMDIQKEAIEATKARVAANVPEPPRQLEFVHDSHKNIVQHVGSNVASLVCFNTGYLPGSNDKSVKTEVESTLDALEGSLETLCDGGLVSFLCYTGHDGGQEEYEAIRKFTSELSSAHWKSSEFRLLNSPSAPVMVLVWKT
jgi:23S rRNA U2552 (ribose-2'-O)-methylase RlmE/FtsJ